MITLNPLEVLALMEEVRTLSFCVESSTGRLSESQTRLQALCKAVTEVSGLQTVFENKTSAVTEKLDQMKTALDLKP